MFGSTFNLKNCTVFFQQAVILMQNIKQSFPTANTKFIIVKWMVTSSLKMLFAIYQNIPAIIIPSVQKYIQHSLFDINVDILT